MKTDINGRSTCKESQESYEFFYSDVLKKEMVQYDYRTELGDLFSCVAKDLETARGKRDKWLNKESN